MTTKIKKSLAALCPNCEETIQFDVQPEIGQLVVCFECDDELEVIALDPIVLSWLLYDEEEWEDDDFDDDDFDDSDADDD